MDKPFCEATDRNKEPILASLTDLFMDASSIFEIGSGTGQHAVFFGKHLSHLTWQTSDLAEKHAGILEWLAQEKLDNVFNPIVLDVNKHDLPQQYDGIFTANTFHIMSLDEVLLTIEKSAKALKPGGHFVVYGPFFFDDRRNAQSNQAFSEYLQEKDPKMGVREYKIIEAQCLKAHLEPVKTIEMPANNFLLVFKKTS